MQPKKKNLIKSKWPSVGHYLGLLSFARYLVNHARWLEHYYKNKCEVLGGGALHPENVQLVQNGRLNRPFVYFKCLVLL